MRARAKLRGTIVPADELVPQVSLRPCCWAPRRPPCRAAQRRLAPPSPRPPIGPRTAQAKLRLVSAVTGSGGAKSVPLGLQIRAGARLEDLLALAGRCRHSGEPGLDGIDQSRSVPISPGRCPIASRSSASIPSAMRTRSSFPSRPRPADPAKPLALRAQGRLSRLREDLHSPAAPTSPSICRRARRRPAISPSSSIAMRAGAGRWRGHGLQPGLRRCGAATRRIRASSSRCDSALPLVAPISSSRGRPGSISRRPKVTLDARRTRAHASPST